MFFAPLAMLLGLAIFDHPEKLCRALESRGIRTGDWTPIVKDSHGLAQEHSPYACQYPPSGAREDTSNPVAVLGLLKIRFPDLTFRVSGDTAGRADSVTIAMTVPPGVDLAKAKKRLLENIQAFFEVIGENPPKGLLLSIEHGQRFLVHETYGSISFLSLNRAPRRSQVLWFQLHRKTPR
ncbi:MAG TPA: hypothetical protein VG672_16630 [Bryobacteraceae bacterium]|nr:hypothetical protein [Bryobacteraceae bacterium]